MNIFSWYDLPKREEFVCFVFLCKRWAPFFQIKPRRAPFLPGFLEVFPRFLGISPRFLGILQRFLTNQNFYGCVFIPCNPASYTTAAFIHGRFKRAKSRTDFLEKKRVHVHQRSSAVFLSSSGCCCFFLYNMNYRRLEANSWRQDFLQIRAMFEHSKWTTVTLQVFWLVVGSLSVAILPASDCAVSPSLSWEIC